MTGYSRSELTSSTIVEEEPEYPYSREIQTMIACIKREWRKNNKTIIAVARNEIKDKLIKSCEQQPRRGLFSGHSRIIITTKKAIQRAVESATKGVKVRYALTLVVSRAIPEVIFDVPYGCEVGALKIINADAAIGGNPLFIDGASTFHLERLDEWESIRHKEKLFLGPNVAIRVGLSGSHWGGSFRSSDTASAAQKERIFQYLHCLARDPMDDSWWQRFKGLIACIVGVLVGVGKFVTGMKVSASGMFVSFKFGSVSLQAGTATVNASAVISAVGPPILLGGLTAAAVYFIPWGEFFSFLKGVMSWLWEGIKNLWSMIRDWVEGMFSGSPSGMPYTARPMRFY
ncbi:hypothetical protein CC80DRAFT_448626 [Byssothecium circinans]|uniref:Uncharacterized protein n=1 Tax=Byssothecium circinans TaxID=147558 RepID=A0A6A5TT46_9PLEO|nr:hypothetical protein CC80DRAFT_448626 [Byssothecium circinans]